MSLILLFVAATILMLVAIRKDFGPMGKKSRRPDYDSPRYLSEYNFKTTPQPDKNILKSIVSKDLDRKEINELGRNPQTSLSPPIHTSIMDKESIMGKIAAFCLGFLLASSFGLTMTLSYFLFCPHNQHQDKTIIITPPELLPNRMLPEIPIRPAPLRLEGWQPSVR